MGRVKAKISDDETAMTDLKPANENPWYVLMTLYGEQTDFFDRGLHEANRRAWNAWVGKHLSDVEKNAAAKTCRIEVAELCAADEDDRWLKKLWHKAIRERLPSEVAKLISFRPRSGISLSKTEFPKIVCLNGFAFPGRLGLQSSEFRSALIVEDAWFKNDVSGQFSYFRGEVLFNRCRMKENFELTHGTFERGLRVSDCTIDGLTRMDSCSFAEKVDCRNSVFNMDASFGDSEFQGTAIFWNCKFNLFGQFIRAKFNGMAHFDGAEFHLYAQFISAQFSKTAWFNKVSFLGDADFGSSRFEDSVFFSNATFSHGKASESPEEIEKVKEVRVDFSNAFFQYPTSFRGAVFERSYPILIGTVMNDLTLFSADENCWPYESSQDPSEAKEICGKIRHVVSKQGLPEDEHFFFRREMHFAGKIGSYWQRVPYRLFGLVSDYGRSIEKPLKLLLTTVVAPSGVFTAYLQTLEGSYNCLEAFHWVPAGLGMSFSNTFKFLGLQRLHFAEAFEEAGTAIHAVAGGQTVLGFVFLFFLGLGLRQRFRLR
ncbi:pentapeptide repeat-containing protein [Pelagimonas sp. KU-00592-HH]|uniref:pentapeptide repeat-containing protein n=1 Tax=Pelagimonas sp. KU-00592-HH TaxID=3127651 RepID=UPI0033412460